MPSAVGKLPEQAQSGGMQDILALIQGLSGSKSTRTTSGGTQTQQTQISAEGMDALIKQMLESNSGLAQVSSGQRAAGLYNSSTNTQLTNDLLSRISGQAALASAPTVTTRTPTNEETRTPGMLGDVNPLVALVAAPLLKSGAAKAGDVLSSVLGGAKGGATPGTAGIGEGISQIMRDVGGNQLGKKLLFGQDVASNAIGEAGFLSQGADFLSQGGNYLGSSVGFGGETSALGDIFSNASLADAGYDLFSSSADLANGLDSAGAFGDMGGVGDYLGPAASIYDIFTADDKGSAVAKGVLNTGVSAVLSSIPVVGPFLAIASSLLGSQSVICTHMHKSGLLSESLYAAEQVYGASVNPRIYAGYRFWADPVVSWLQKSPRATKFFAPLVREFAKEISYSLGFSTKGSIIGKGLKLIGEPTCYILSFLAVEGDSDHAYA